MPGYQLTVRIDRPAPEVFDFVATHQVENHPIWEPEVLSIRKQTEGPLRAGSQAVMTRRDFGYRREVPYSVTAFEPERMIALRSVERSLTFDIAFHFAPAGPTHTDLRIEVGLRPAGMFKPLAPVMTAMFRRNGTRLARRLKHAVEADGDSRG